MKIKINAREHINVAEHTGKMEFIPSISTDKLLNGNCAAMMKSANDKCICKHCYVDKTFKLYKQLEPTLINNTRILAGRLLTRTEVSQIARSFCNTSIARFESFGDLNNVTQLRNYAAIARMCKHTKFALFTKHFKVVLEYFRAGSRLPDNVTLVLSSPFIDYALNKPFVDAFRKYHRRTITFTVTEDKANPGINCGKRKCVECRNCYDSKYPHDVLELVK